MTYHFIYPDQLYKALLSFLHFFFSFANLIQMSWVIRTLGRQGGHQRTPTLSRITNCWGKKGSFLPPILFLLPICAPRGKKSRGISCFLLGVRQKSDLSDFCINWAGKKFFVAGKVIGSLVFDRNPNPPPSKSLLKILSQAWKYSQNSQIHIC